MAKAIRFGVAAVFALAVSAPAWAGDGEAAVTPTQPDDIATSDTSVVDSPGAVAPPEFGAGSGEPNNSNDDANATNDLDLQNWPAD